jgi:hypothetical protein
MTRLPSKGPNSPFSPGNRTLLARTCRDCGELVDGESFPLINQGEGGRRKVCHNCQNARKKRDREERGIGVPVPRPKEELQTNRKQLWTEADDTYLRENIEHLSYEEIAVHLGRSLSAVYKRREVLGITVVRKAHRVLKPWQIKLAPMQKILYCCSHEQ